jgi:hypothetical protein
VVTKYGETVINMSLLTTGSVNAIGGAVAVHRRSPTAIHRDGEFIDCTGNLNYWTELSLSSCLCYQEIFYEINT